jgi:hypothetical protein
MIASGTSGCGAQIAARTGQREPRNDTYKLNQSAPWSRVTAMPFSVVV